ncbi:hypothetical protein PR202_gb24095 [Eleusine coracana subsp. coracana]|uniref:Kinesin motor domain-containing protein n=1 Tax=Eleusine coracana subsp. coracana TaxID=191504 RepID=A0AAV5FHX4_ELECO|nr:hypothetical protein PR202_gb24095 [Eleusine coracana subsp. coracana]
MRKDIGANEEGTMCVLTIEATGKVKNESGSTNETLITLQFAQHARLIQNNAVINEHSSGDKFALQCQKCFLEEQITCLKHRGFSRCSSCTGDRSGGAFDCIIENVNMDTKSKSNAEDRRSLQDLQISNNEVMVDEDRSDALSVHGSLGRHLLGQIEKGNEEIADLKVELAKKIDELNMVSMQNAEL